MKREPDIEIARAFGGADVGNIDDVREGIDQPVAQLLHLIGLEADGNGQPDQLIERAVLLHADAVGASADTRRQIQPSRERRHRRGQIAECRNAFDVDQHAMGQRRTHDGQLPFRQTQSQRTHGIDAATDLGLDVAAVLQRCRNAFLFGDVQRFATALLQRLQPVVQRLIVCGDQSALVDAEILGQAGDHRIALRQQRLDDLPQRGIAPLGVVFNHDQRVFQHAGTVQHQRNAVLLQQRLHLFEVRQRHRAAAAGIVGQLDADIADLRRVRFDLGLQRGQVDVALEGFIGLQVEHFGHREFQRRETLVDLMVDGAGKQNVLRYPALLFPCLAEQVFRGASGFGQREMRERKHATQTGVHVDRTLDLREQDGHLPVDNGQMQLRPGIGLQIEIDLCSVEILRIETGRFQRSPARR